MASVPSSARPGGSGAGLFSGVGQFLGDLCGRLRAWARLWRFWARRGRHLGRFCVDELKRLGVDVQTVRVEPGLKTGITASFSSEDRALVTFPGAIAELTAYEISRPLLAGFTHLHISSYYLQRALQPGLAGLCEMAKQAGLTVSLDPGHDPSGEWSPALWDAFPNCDVLFLNEVELAALSGCSEVTQGLRAISSGP